MDTSRSQGIERRLSFAKGAVLALLSQAYISRDKVGVLLFYDQTCELILPFTKSANYASKCLQDIPAFGKTPLGPGLRKAMEVFRVEKTKDADLRPLLILLTDGKATYDDLPGPPIQLALEAAKEVKASGIPTLVIDTEGGVFSIGLAQKLAEEMDAVYAKL
ncbi:MAG: VWA domain-containing protein [Filifactor alocis]|nr:VWA domain-containing protein [Filifactor alocis]